MRTYINKLTSSLFVKNVFLTFSNKILLLVVGLFTSVAIARVLGPEGRGLFATAMLFLGFGVQFGNLGLHSTNIHLSATNAENSSVLFGNSIAIGFFVGICLAIILIIIKFIFPNFVPISGSLFLITISIIPISLTYLLLQNLLIGLSLINDYNKIELYSKIILTILIFIFISIGLKNPQSIMFATLVSALVALMYTFKLLKVRAAPIFSYFFFLNHFNYGLKAYLAALFAFSQQKIIVYFITKYSGLTNAGYFSISQTLFDLSLIFPVTVASILFPRLSSSKSEYEKWESTRKVIVYISVFMLSYIFFINLVGSFLINNLYGNNFHASFESLKKLLPGLFFLSLVSIIMNYLASIGMPIIVVIAPLLSTISIILLCFFFKSDFSLSKASLINSFGNFLSFTFSIIYFIKIKPSKYDTK